MPDFPAARLAEWTGGHWTATPAAPLSGFSIDSRTVRAGQVFVALRTEKRDGHDFVGAAAAAGASAALVAREIPGVSVPQLVVPDPLRAFQTIAREHRRRFPGRVIGISGSAGKTSTKDLLALLLGGASCGVPATEEKFSATGRGQGPGGQPAARNEFVGGETPPREQHKPEIGRGGVTPPIVPASSTGRVLATEGNLNKASFESGASLTGRVLATEGNLNKASFESGASLTGRVLATEGNLNKASFESGASLTGRVLATEGNLNNHLGVPLTLTRIDPAAHDFAVVEAGISAPGEMQPLAEMIEPDVAIITLVAPAHTEELGGLDGVALEKSRLPAATRAAGVAVFSRETSAYSAFRELNVRAMVVERADVLRPAEPPKDTVYYTLTQRDDETAVAIAYGKPPPLVFTLRRVSDGMAQNAVIAICAALWLGVAPATIQARLAASKPAKLRGEIRRDRGRMLYLDCYNANPASMADALATFASIAPATDPRLYLIGCMEELGADSASYHRALGRLLALRPGDQVFVIGSHAGDVCAGANEAHGVGGQVHVATSVDAIGEVVRLWRGAVFVKGSRRYQLERAVESTSGGGSSAGARCAAAALSSS